MRSLQRKKLSFYVISAIYDYFYFIILGGIFFVFLSILTSCTGSQVAFTADTARIINDLTLKSSIIDEKLSRTSARAEEVAKIASDKSLSISQWLEILTGGTALVTGSTVVHNKIRNKGSKDRVRSAVLSMKDELKKHLT